MTCQSTNPYDGKVFETYPDMTDAALERALGRAERANIVAKAIALANDPDFGLGGSLYTKDIARGKRVASHIDTRMMFIDNIDWSDAALPFGGIRNSGYGRELGDMGIQQFENKKLVRVVNSMAPA